VESDQILVTCKGRLRKVISQNSGEWSNTSYYSLKCLVNQYFVSIS